MPHVEARLYATLRQYAPELGIGEALSLDLPTGTTVRDLLAQLQVPAGQVKIIFVNYRAVPMEYVLQEGDRVSIFPPVAGG